MADLFHHVAVAALGASYDLSRDLTALQIEEDRTRPDMLSVTVNDPYHVFSHAFQEGMEIEVDLGTVDDHSLVFRGRIYNVDANFPEDTTPSLVIRAYDNSMKLGLRQRNRVFAGANVTLSSIVQQIALPYGFVGVQVQVDGDPSFPGNGIRQHEETDLEFLRRLAVEYGCELFIEANDIGDTLKFVSQHSIMFGEPGLTLHYRRRNVENCLATFQPNSSISNIQLPRRYAGVDYDTGDVVEAESQEADQVDDEDPLFDENLLAYQQAHPDRALQLNQLVAAGGLLEQQVRNEMGNVERTVVPNFVTAENLESRAANQFSTSLRGMRANGSTPGNHRLHAQMTARIVNVGGRFSGVWYLSKVTHTLDDQGYQTTFECER